VHFEVLVNLIISDCLCAGVMVCRPQWACS